MYETKKSKSAGYLTSSSNSFIAAVSNMSLENKLIQPSAEYRCVVLSMIMDNWNATCVAMYTKVSRDNAIGKHL